MTKVYTQHLKILLVSITLLLGGFLMVHNAEAVEFLKQTNSTTLNSDRTTNTISQTLGTGLTATSIQEIKVYVEAEDTSPTSSIKVYLVECNTATIESATCAAIFASNSGGGSPNIVLSAPQNVKQLATADYTYYKKCPSFTTPCSTGSGYTLDSSKYYTIVVESQGGQFTKLYGSGSSTYSAGSCILGSPGSSPTACADTADLFFVLENGLAPTMAFTSPPPDTSFPLGYEIPFDGTCPTNGSGQILVHVQGYEDNYTSCTDNQFSFSLPARDYGSYTVVITDKDDSSKTASLAYVVDPQFAEWIMNLNYPRCPSPDQCIEFNLEASSNFPVRWAYKVPSSADKASVNYRFREYTNKSFSTLQSGGVSFEEDLETLLQSSDRPDLEFHDDHMAVTSGSTRYYKAELIYGGVVKVFHLFAVTGGTGNGYQAPTLPPIVQSGCNVPFGFGALCTLFIPSSGYFTSKISKFRTDMEAVPPFTYFLAVEDKVGGIGATTTTANLIDFDIPVAGATLEFQGFNTAAGSPERGIFDLARTYINVFLWLGFAWYAGNKVFRMFKPL